MYGHEDNISKMSDTNGMAIKTPSWAITSTLTVSRQKKKANNHERTKVAVNISCR